MIEIYQKADERFIHSIDDVVVLDHSQREKGRLKLVGQSGNTIGIFLERGNVLQRDEILKSVCKKYIRVAIAKERVVTARTNSWETFSRACYHLGNRHARVQVGELWLRFIEDSVLMELMERLGLETFVEQAEFEPEPGAYGHGYAGKSSHNHGHMHAH